MRLIEAELENVCQFKSLHVKFDPGLTAIVGPNGSGKSNFLASVYACITGDWSRFATNKDKVTSQYANLDDNSGMRVVMDHHGVRADIKRMIRPNERSLVIGDRTPITADKLIDKAIESWFGLPIKVIGQYVFVPQWEMFALLNDGPAKRADNLFKLFGLDKADQCYSSVVKKLSLTNPGMLVDVDSVRSRLISNRSKIREQTLKLNSTPDRSTQIADFKRVIANWEHKCQLIDEIDRIYNDLDLTQTALIREEMESARLYQELLVLQEQFKQISSEVEQAKKEKVELETYTAVQLSRTKITDSITRHNNKLSELLCPIRPDCCDDASLESRFSILSDEIKEAHKFLASITDDTSECPVCNTPVEQLQDQITKYKAIISTGEPELAILRQQLQQCKQYDVDLIKFESDKKQYENYIESLKKQLADLPAIQPPKHTEYEIYTTIESYKQCQRMIIDKEVLHVEKLTNIAHYKGVCENLDTSSREKSDAIDELDVSYQDHSDAVEEIAAIQADNQRRQLINSELSILKRAVSDDEVILEEAQLTVNRAQKLSSWRTELASVRDVMHRNALPKVIAQSHLEKLETQMNRSLEELGVDFRVKTGDDLKFQAIFTDGIRNVPAEALSGGEKVVFALAWRLAVNSEFASDVGILCLDEPTAGLDTDRLGCLKTAIEQMRIMSHSRGLQCIIVTHADSLIPLFDSVIELKPPTL